MISRYVLLRKSGSFMIILVYFFRIQYIGKTFRADRTNEFTVKRVNDLSICPVLGLEKYVNESKTLNINLGNGYLFRALSASRKVVLDNPVTSAAMSDRFKKYLSAVIIFEGETLHGLRGACAITLASTGAGESVEKIMGHVGWFSKSSFKRYSRLSQMVNNNSVASMFSAVADTDTSHVSAMFDQYGNKHCLSRAF